jgi:DNA-binding transcriptional regulator YhcF (GntR family)
VPTVSLDPDDPRPPYQQVANAVRAAILTRSFKPGDKLPSLNELSERYGVARMTVQQAMRILREEGLIVSRQGSGVFVRERTERPVGLRPHLERAFEQERVALDFAGFSGETLQGVVQEPLDKIRAGRLRPRALRIRMLLPDPETPWTLPARTEDLEDDPQFRARMGGIASRHTSAIVDSVGELAEFGVVEQASAEVRVHRSAPLFKLYVLNGSEVFFGFYPVRQHKLTIKGEAHAVYDLVGKDATLFHHAAGPDPDSLDSQYVRQAREWFDSMWENVAREIAP